MRQPKDILSIPRSTLSFQLHRLIKAGRLLKARHGNALICHADLIAPDKTLGSRRIDD